MANDPNRITKRSPDLTTRVPIFAAYRDLETAAEVVEKLAGAGVPQSHISILVPENTNLIPKVRAAVPEGAVVGTVAGALLAGLGVAATLALPGVGVLAAGPILALVEGSALGAIGGGFIGSLAGIGVPENQAKQYAEALLEDGVVLCVNHDDDEMAWRVRSILEKTRAAKLVPQANASQDVAIQL